MFAAAPARTRRPALALASAAVKRQLATVATAIALVAVVPASAAARPFEGERWRPGLEAAREYAATRAGSVGFALRTRRRLYRYGAYASYPSASVVKAMLMVAYLNHESVRGRSLTDADHDLLDPMVRWSDNVAATRIRDFVGNDALERLADRAGTGRFVTHPIWGLTQITAAGQSKLFLRIDRRVVRRHRRTALRLLGSIVPEQRWGVGRVQPRGWALYFKGGWGDGSGVVDHQVALLRRGRRRVALAILTSGNPSHEYGNETLEGVARRLLAGLGPWSLPR
jgi:Beta-lactamase enzyme family